MKSVLILMATYNGSEFIEEQLASLRAQSYADWRLWVRDDGSTDDTVEKVRRFAAQDQRVCLLEPDGIRKGASGSFSCLMDRFAPEADYLMFCDQDDVWFPNKIEITLARMREMETRFGIDIPLLVHTDLSVTDRELNVTAASFCRYQGLNPDVQGLHRLVVQNNVTGCTMMVNRALALLAGPVPASAIMHDWWLAMVAAGFGNIGHISQPTMLYRQHGANDTGAKNYGWEHMFQKALGGLAGMKASLLKTQSQACAFLERYASRLEPEQRLLVNAYCHLSVQNFWARRWQMLRFGFFKHGFFRNIGMLLAL
ncbi:MAG: glycosyltransferase family 2 protein [Nitrosomonadales bacterium]|nr:MAG: glycosyltransferase family 2 protein [Nitrosomonadales bacterium]